MASNTTVVISDMLIPALDKLHEIKGKPLIAAILVLFVGFSFNLAFVKSPPEAKVPFVGLEIGSLSKRKKKYVTSAGQLLSEGYDKFKDGLFQITTTEGNFFLVLNSLFHF